MISGEPFAEIKELKKILVNRHRREFYRCLTEKLLTYALGRGLESYDVGAVDTIVARIEGVDGHASALIAGIIESTPFQKRRRSAKLEQDATGLLGQSARLSTEPLNKGADHER